MPSPSRRPACLAAAITALLTLSSLLVLPVLSAGPLAATGAATAATLPVEGYASYDPQDTCSPTAKPGTQKLLAWLVKTYPGSTSMGISRPCGSGGTSEHKEGRALDWGVNYSNSRDRANVTAFLNRVFATDAAGNPHALARRMGIMYIIWDDKIWASYRKFEQRAYLHSGCKQLSSCSATLRHRDHVHISLSRAGGRGATSWYGGTTSTPPPPTPTPTPEPTPEPTPAPPPPAAPVLDLSERRYARIVVPADGRVVTTPFALAAGRAYKLTAGGTMRYAARAFQVADASCLRMKPRKPFRRGPGAKAARAGGSVNLRVDGKPVLDRPCRRDHRYATGYRTSSTKQLRLRMVNDRARSAGRIVVLVSLPKTNVSAGLPRR